MAKKTKVMEKIAVPRGNIKMLAEHFHCSPLKVSQALSYMLPLNPSHEMIRQEALKNFGGAITQIYVPI